MTSDGQVERGVDAAGVGPDPDEARARLELEIAAARAEIEHLREAVRTRTVIGQAQGWLMASMGFDEEQAMAYLRRVSSHENRKLRDIAAEIARTRGRPAEGR